MGPDNAVWLGDGEWIAFEDFGPFDPDEVADASLPQLEWEADMQRRFPRAELSVIRTVVRIMRAAAEYHDASGRHLNIYGALGELYGALAWGIRLHQASNTQGSDGRLANDWIEIKTLSPRNGVGKVSVKRDGNFNKLLVVRCELSTDANWPGGLRITSRMVDRRHLFIGRSRNSQISWTRACQVGLGPPVA